MASERPIGFPRWTFSCCFSFRYQCPSHWSTYPLLSHSLVWCASSPQPPYQPYPTYWLNNTRMAPLGFIHHRTEKIARCNTTCFLWSDHFLDMAVSYLEHEPLFSGPRMGLKSFRDMSICDMASHHSIPDGLSSP